MSRISRNLILLLAVAFSSCGYSFASSTARIAVNGAEQAGDASSITIAFTDSNGNSYSETVSYGQFSTPASVASTVGGMFANSYVSGHKLSAQVYCGTTNSVLLKLQGSATFGNLTVTGSTTSFHLTSSGFANSPALTVPTIAWAAPAPITSGTALSGTQLNATANVSGVFSYFPELGTVLDPGTQTLSVIFTPTDTLDYASAAAAVSLVVNAVPTGQETPTISWATPAAISYGTALSSTQLNASASYGGTSIPGTFEYTPAAGEVLEAGTQALLVAFFPSDSVHYAPSGGSVLLTVNAAAPPQTIYSYSITSYASNSNLQSYADSVAGTWSFNYDSLNRLTTGTPSTGQNLCWAYDSFGNRTAQVSQSAACPSSESSVTPTVSYNSNNQLTGGILSYDAAGDVTSDTTTGNSYLYDGEGRLCAVRSEPIPGTYTMTQYIYDAEGNRVAKGTITNWSAGCNIASNGFTPTNSYVIGPSGEQLTETDGQGNWLHTNVYAAGMLIATYDMPPNGQPAVHFQLEDWLGTRRVQTDIAGNTEETYTSLPFGDGFVTSIPPGAPPTADDGTEHHFTGKERDSESGNDYFGARYYSSSMGRFMSPDWSAQAEPVPYAKLGDPQSFNLYSYVENAPLNSVDANGHAAMATPTAPLWQNALEGSGSSCSVTDGQECTDQPGGVNPEANDEQEAESENNAGVAAGKAEQSTAQAQQQSPQAQSLVNAQNAAMANGAYQPNTPTAGTTHCSEAACAIAKGTGADLTGILYDSKGNNYDANTQINNLAGSSGYHVVTPDQAQALGDKGVLVFGTQHGALHGHIASVRPEGVPGDNPRGRSGPILANVGLFNGVAHQSAVMTPAHGAIVYYAPNQ